MWRFVLSDPEKCLFYMQYYYSPYFKRCSDEIHLQTYSVAADRFGRVFKEGTDIWWALHYILDVMLTASVHVFRGEWPNTSELEHGMFQLIYRALSPYLSEKNIQQL